MTTPSNDQLENAGFSTEIKFLIAPALAQKIHEWSRTRLAPDPHGSGESSDAYQITSLYFDTEAFDTFYRRGSFGRSKYRIRRYEQSEVAFLERKLKTRSLLKKRRSIITLGQLARLTNGKPERGWAGFWFHRRLRSRQLKPMCEITYRRIARVAATPYGEARLTFDDNIRALRTNDLVFNGARDGELLSKNQIILELKYHFTMPALFKQLVEEFALNPQPISKYRLAAVALKYVPEPDSNAPATNRMEGNTCPTS